jgi:hypothetical protein
MIQTHRISRLLNVTRTHLWLRSGSYQLSSSADPAQPPSGHRKESSEQAVGGTTDDIAHSKGAFDSGEANPHKSAAKLSSVRSISLTRFSRRILDNWDIKDSTVRLVDQITSKWLIALALFGFGEWRVVLTWSSRLPTQGLPFHLKKRQRKRKHRTLKSS